MDMDILVELGARALTQIVLLSAPAVLAALVVGLVVSIFQAATQLQEQTLTFAPKLVAVCFVLFVAGQWMLEELVALARDMFLAIAAGL